MRTQFFPNVAATEKVSLDWLSKDCQAAQLSRAFRIYYQLRPLIPIAFRQFLQRNRQVEAEEDWYLPDTYRRLLMDALRGQSEPLPILHPWPDAAPFAFVLTHDVETKEGMENIMKVAEMEEELGFRSSWNIIPFKYKVDKGLLRELQSRSFEIGVHGYNHDGRLYSSRRTFQRRAAAINNALREYGAVGFRSPMVHRNLDWLQLLDIEYDASFFDVDPYQAMPGGVGTIWPFVSGKFVELPYTLPQDHTLFIALGQRDCQVWRRKLEYIVRHCGMALVLTHPDYLVMRDNLELYREFLTGVRDAGGYWHALPREVTAWWRQRQQHVLGERDTETNSGNGAATPYRIVPANIEVADDEMVITVTSAPRNSPSRNPNCKRGNWRFPSLGFGLLSNAKVDAKRPIFRWC